jgi:hypothetical protein
LASAACRLCGGAAIEAGRRASLQLIAAAIGPRLWPLLVERHFAIVDALLVLPFLA